MLKIMLNISCINRNFLIFNSLGIKYLLVCVLSGTVMSDSLQSHGLRLSPPGSSVHGIFQARIQEWTAISSPVDLPDSGIRPICRASPALAAKLYHWITWKPLYTHKKPIWNITNIMELLFRNIFQTKKQYRSINSIKEIIQWINIEWINQ